MKKAVYYAVALTLLMIGMMWHTLHSEGIHHVLMWSSLRFEEKAYIIESETGEVVGTTVVKMDGCANFLTQKYSGSIDVKEYPVPRSEAQCLRMDNWRSIIQRGNIGHFTTMA